MNFIFTIALLSLLAAAAAANGNKCVKIKKEKKCVSRKGQLWGCTWCDNSCVHYANCPDRVTDCSKFDARKKKQAKLCRAMGCVITKQRECVSALSEETKAPTTASPTTMVTDILLETVEEKSFDDILLEAVDKKKRIKQLPKDVFDGLDKRTIKLIRKNPGKVLVNPAFGPADQEPDKNRFSFATRPPTTESTEGESKPIIDLCGSRRKGKLGQKGYCGSSLHCKCDAGEGSCLSDEDCKEGLTCTKNRGKYYGFPETVSVCEPGSDPLTDSGLFEGDIDIVTSKQGINQIVEIYGEQVAQVVANTFPLSADFNGAIVQPERYNPTRPPIVISTPPPFTKVDIPGIIGDFKNNIRGGRQLMNTRRSLAAEKDSARFWKDGIVPYTIRSGVSDSVRNVIEDAIAHWEEHTCIRLRLKTDSDPDYVEFIEPPSAVCSSVVGRDGGRQIIKLHQRCGFGAAVHEIGHALGLWHEQSRPDRDGYVDIKLENVRDGKAHNFAKQAFADIDDKGSIYDYGSIMHYGEKAFSKNDEDTIVPREEGAVIGQREGLSENDIWQINRMYNCTSCPAGYSEHNFYTGKAPFCNGKCPRTAIEIGRHKSGGGGRCWIGTKAHCQSCCQLRKTQEHKWFGTAPFCNPKRCPSGWTFIRSDKRGDGALCLTGKKFLCRRVTSRRVCTAPKKMAGSCPPGGRKHATYALRCPAGWREDSSSGFLGLSKHCSRTCESIANLWSHFKFPVINFGR